MRPPFNAIRYCITVSRLDGSLSQWAVALPGPRSIHSATYYHVVHILPHPLGVQANSSPFPCPSHDIMRSGGRAVHCHKCCAAPAVYGGDGTYVQYSLPATMYGRSIDYRLRTLGLWGTWASMARVLCIGKWEGCSRSARRSPWITQHKHIPSTQYMPTR